METVVDSSESETRVSGNCKNFTTVKTLSSCEREMLERQDARGLLGEFQQQKLEKEAAKNWDKFYKRNETRFFKDRHWTTREFQELIGDKDRRRTLLEIGCGVGNFLYPLLEENLNLFIYACDFSPRAVQFVKDHPEYDEMKVHAFQCDITEDDLISVLSCKVDIISLIFVLSAIHPEKFTRVLANVYDCLDPGGIVLVRDYGVYDMAMMRFGPGSKLGDRFYVRQDGTRAYYFTVEQLDQLFGDAGFEVSSNCYVSRQTVNKKEGVNAERIFIQGKFTKPVH